ncbi:hypothetical protein PRIPAC_94328 [Pristionchus pacificus]|uniref:Uncharacterized protein n=1 Tax=Pristionchus pacificus TaxID=54126 RepID=A0A454XJW5_PRIPA|nr:hypothetical protein PRIPAC_94328 [Pristionchus pacificus]|eukprot:PDM68037.1 hypothetical protein PRIPAC_46081 [Pristionchus pacificus]
MASQPLSYYFSLFLTIIFPPTFLIMMCGRGKKNQTQSKATTPSDISRTSRRAVSSHSELPQISSSDNRISQISQILAATAPPPAVIPISPPPPPARAAVVASAPRAATAAAPAAPASPKIISPRSESGTRTDMAKIKDQSNNWGKPVGAALSPVASDPLDSSYAMPERRQVQETPKASSTNDSDLFHTFNSDNDDNSEKKDPTGSVKKRSVRCKTPQTPLEQATQSCSYLVSPIAKT